MTKKDRPLLVATQPLEDRLEQVRAKIADHEQFHGPDAPAVRAAKWVVAEIEDALVLAEEAWEPTASAAASSGWDEQTLTKYARRKLAGETLPHAWRSIDVRDGPGGYAFRLSSLPVKPRKSG